MTMVQPLAGSFSHVNKLLPESTKLSPMFIEHQNGISPLEDIDALIKIRPYKDMHTTSYT